MTEYFIGNLKAAFSDDTSYQKLKNGLMSTLKKGDLLYILEEEFYDKRQLLLFRNYQNLAKAVTGQPARTGYKNTELTLFIKSEFYGQTLPIRVRTRKPEHSVKFDDGTLTATLECTRTLDVLYLFADSSTYEYSYYWPHVFPVDVKTLNFCPITIEQLLEKHYGDHSLPYLGYKDQVKKLLYAIYKMWQLDKS